MSNFSVRHGDLYLEQIDAIPKGVIQRNSSIILGGTATGHAHKLVNGVIFDSEGTVYVQAQINAALTHEEHNRIDLPKGNYSVTRQREFDPYAQSIRNVED